MGSAIVIGMLWTNRDCHQGSKLVHVCDVYDALRTNRPYRDAWSKEEVLAYLQDRSGIEFDGEMVRAFCQMMGEWEPAAAFESEAPEEGEAEGEAEPSGVPPENQTDTEDAPAPDDLQIDRD